MAIDRQFIGYRMAPFEVLVDAERVRRFIRAIGAPTESIPPGTVPPTFLKVIEGEGNSSRRLLEVLGVNLQRVLHAEQEFEFGDPVVVGDRLIVERVVSDIFDRKNGSLEFIVVDSSIHRTSGQWAGRSRQSILIRDPRIATPA
jgi:N-terminal half of MaoC dehydratase